MSSLSRVAFVTAVAVAAPSVRAVPPPTVTDTAGSVHCPGGEHDLSSQIMYWTWQRRVRSPGAASAGTFSLIDQLTSTS